MPPIRKKRWMLMRYLLLSRGGGGGGEEKKKVLPYLFRNPGHAASERGKGDVLVP